MNRFQKMGIRNLANRVRGQMANRTRRPRPGMNKGGPRPGVRPGPGMNMGRPRPGVVRRPAVVRRPGGAGMDYSKMLSQLNRVPGGMSPGPMGRPTGMRPGGGPQLQDFRLTQAAGIAGRPVNSFAEADRIMAQRGGTGAAGGMPPQTGGNPFRQSRKMAEGGEVLKTPVDKLPNEGLKKLAKSPKGRKAVARMGFKDGGIAKGGKCPSRGTIRGTGAAIRGVGFKGIK